MTNLNTNYGSTHGSTYNEFVHYDHLAITIRFFPQKKRLLIDITVRKCLDITNIEYTKHLLYYSYRLAVRSQSSKPRRLAATPLLVRVDLLGGEPDGTAYCLAGADELIVDLFFLMADCFAGIDLFFVLADFDSLAGANLFFLLADSLAGTDELFFTVDLFFLMADCFAGVDLFFVPVDFVAEAELLFVMVGCCAGAEEVIFIVDCLAGATVDLAFVMADWLELKKMNLFFLWIFSLCWLIAWLEQINCLSL